ncbi:MAG: hypothetical protein R3B90_20315 [Planctomycetaceae bacterium]
MPLGLDELRVEPGVGKERPRPLRGPSAVGVVAAHRAHTWDRKPLTQLAHQLVWVVGKVILNRSAVGHRDPLLT